MLKEEESNMMMIITGVMPDYLQIHYFPFHPKI